MKISWLRQVLARICIDKFQFNRVLHSLIQLFLEDRLLLETRGALIMRKLCNLLDARGIYLSMASILNEKSDLEFSSMMVQTLNLILLTAPELSPFRKALKKSFRSDSSEADREGFTSLFQCWVHNPVVNFIWSYTIAVLSVFFRRRRSVSAYSHRHTIFPLLLYPNLLMLKSLLVS